MSCGAGVTAVRCASGKLFVFGINAYAQVCGFVAVALVVDGCHDDRGRLLLLRFMLLLLFWLVHLMLHWWWWRFSGGGGGEG